MHGTFFVSLWKREKCANRFLAFHGPSRRTEKGERPGDERDREGEGSSRTVCQSDRTCTIPIPYMRYRCLCDYGVRVRAGRGAHLIVFR